MLSAGFQLKVLLTLSDLIPEGLLSTDDFLQEVAIIKTARQKQIRCFIESLYKVQKYTIGKAGTSRNTQVYLFLFKVYMLIFHQNPAKQETISLQKVFVWRNFDIFVLSKNDKNLHYIIN